MKKSFNRLLITSGLVASLAACSGSGSTSSNNGGGNQGDATQLTFVAPNIVPSLPTASTSYVVVNNPTSSVVTGVKYQLGNIIGGAANVSIDPTSSANCATVAANASCTFKLITQANSLAGSFNISASNNATLLNNLVNKSNNLTANLPTTPTIGVEQVLYTTTTGANGITLYYFNTVVAGVPMVMVTGVVNSDQAGSLNTVTLLGADGNPIPNQQVVSGNMGAGAPGLTMGSTFSILLPAPTGADATQTIKVKTEQIAANGTISNTQISTNSSTLTTTTAVAIIDMLPSSIYLTESNPTQQITFSNTGDVAAQLQSLVASNSNIEVIFSSASVAPGGKATATLRLKDSSVPAASSSITLSYNNGKVDVQQSSSVDQNVVPGPDPTPVPPPGPTPVAGLTASLANNNFNVTTANHTTTESMTITNTGNTTENNFVVTMPNNNFSLVNNAGSATNCKVTSGAIDLSQSLESSTNCVVTVKYDNSTITTGSGNISVAYKYNNGTAAPTPATAAVNWKVTPPSANLSITGNVANPYIFPTTLSDGSGESSTYLFTIKNTGEVTATGISSVVNSTTLAGLFTANNTGATPAACGATLAVGASCQLGVKFGSIPDNTSAGTKNGNLTITYKAFSGATTNTTITQNLQGQVASAGSAVFNAPSSGTATGFTNNTWASLAINQNVTTGVITYTLTNTGADAATNFIVTLPSAPNGWESMSTNCPTATGTNLAPQASCNVTLKANTATAGTITATNFTLGLAWSDQDSPRGETQNMQIATPAVTVAKLAAKFNPPTTGTATGFSNNTWSSLSIDQNAATGLITYTLTNTGNATAEDFDAYPEVIPSGWHLSGSSTCIKKGLSVINLAPSESCSIDLKPETDTVGTISRGTLQLIMSWVDVSSPDGTDQRMQITTPAVTVTAAPDPFPFVGPYGIVLSPSGAYAFITNYDDSTVTQCSVNNGALSNCTDSGATGLTTPSGITLNSAGTYAFITDVDDNIVRQCSVNNGTLSNCADSGATGLLFPTAITLNSAGTYAFILSGDNSTASQCSVNNGTLSNCADSGATGLAFPTAITLNSAGTYAFITNGDDSTVSQCVVSNGMFSDCVNYVSDEFNVPSGITLNPVGTYAYITNSDNNSVTKCSLNNGMLNNCSNSGAATIKLATPIGITLNSTGTYAFITNAGDGTITQCSVNVNNGTLSNCAHTGFQ